MAVPHFLRTDKFEGYVPDAYVATMRMLYNKDTVNDTKNDESYEFNIKAMLKFPADGSENPTEKLPTAETVAKEIQARFVPHIDGTENVVPSQTEGTPPVQGSPQPQATPQGGKESGKAPKQGKAEGAQAQGGGGAQHTE
jgi:hypothetical protein|nr:MAG TPA: hypothetical protein [Caudoviricetes sp.]